MSAVFIYDKVAADPTTEKILLLNTVTQINDNSNIGLKNIVITNND